MAGNPDPKRGALFGDRNFRWVFSGALISMLGDQFSLIALPWLVLQMTGDTLVLGTVLAIMSIPRALFILLGGALVDRYSPKRVLMLTKHVNTVLLAVLAALVLSGHLTLWAVYALALGIGLATAFSIPAGTSLLPHVISRELLPAAKGVQMGVRQLSMFAGPLLAGLLIALFGDSAAATIKDARGIGMAFALDALTFAVSAWTLSQVRPHAKPAGTAPAASSVWKSVGEGLRYCWNDDSLRICFSYWAAVALLISGPVQVAVPVLADHVGSGAAAFGALAGAHGAGTLLGVVVTSIRPQLRFGNLGKTILLLDGVIGLLFIPLGLISAIWQGMLLLLVIGVLGGFLQVTIYTWLQRHAAPAMLGRTMALFMFIFMGLAPMSSAVTGWVMRFVPLEQLFAASGVILVAIVVVAWSTSRMRTVSDGRTEAGMTPS
ncbi:MFS transporter [Noviherbaspirillum sp. Root189]|uniref:MFS transporter n=1 Tax=Noviherbaspirillum sp. Root189 TaxID=1736487 RepID=UPI00070AA689|nr:MFS transporter [Noviherbaspirillum sp. Root189]KRB79175.1 MFS transporter [Noviherbaspirillum sp. Root189]